MSEAKLEANKLPLTKTPKRQDPQSNLKVKADWISSKSADMIMADGRYSNSTTSIGNQEAISDFQSIAVMECKLCAFSSYGIVNGKSNAK